MLLPGVHPHRLVPNLGLDSAGSTVAQCCLQRNLHSKLWTHEYRSTTQKSSRPDATCLQKPSDCKETNPFCNRLEIDFEIPFYDDYSAVEMDYSPNTNDCLRNYIISYMDEKILRFLRDQSYDQFLTKLTSLYR